MLPEEVGHLYGLLNTSAFYGGKSGIVDQFRHNFVGFFVLAAEETSGTGLPDFLCLLIFKITTFKPEPRTFQQAAKLTEAIARNGDAAEKRIFVVNSRARVRFCRADGDHQRNQMVFSRMSQTCRRCLAPIFQLFVERFLLLNPIPRTAAV